MFLPLMLLWLRAPMYFPPRLRWCLLTLCLVSMLQTPGSAAQPPTFRDADPRGGSSWASNKGVETENAEPNAEPSPANGLQTAPQRQREGTVVREVEGRLVEVGRRWVFIATTDGTSFRILENLALQRITNAVKQDAGDDHWTITGQWTEYGNENFLMLQRVVRTPHHTNSENLARRPRSGL